MGGQASKSSKKNSNPYAKTSKVYGQQEAPAEHDIPSDDEFYDGIPRYRRSLSHKSRSRRAKVSEMAAGMLDNLGNSMANLNPGTAFVSGGSVKSNELSILSFEVANTIVKASTILHSISTRSVKLLVDIVLPSQPVQTLVSTNMDLLLSIVAADKREELRIFAGEVVRFGNRCKDPQWHNLDLFFKKHSRDPQKQTREEAEFTMQQLMILVQHTAELYQELHTLDRFKQEYQHKCVEAGISNTQSRGDSSASLAAELKTKKKLVKSLKKKSLWSRSLEGVMGKLVDIVLFLNREITNVFKNSVDDEQVMKLLGGDERLGSSGLALHYANIILLIDSVVGRSSTVPQNARETLYQSLTPSLRSALRSKSRTFHVTEQHTVAEIKTEMEATLQWLVPIATNTAKAHHGFGWVGEWGSTGSGSNRETGDVIQIETLHHANRQKTEVYILELLLWLNHLVSKFKVNANDGEAKPNAKILAVKETDTALPETASLPLPLPSDDGKAKPNAKIPAVKEIDAVLLETASLPLPLPSDDGKAKPNAKIPAVKETDAVLPEAASLPLPSPSDDGKEPDN